MHLPPHPFNSEDKLVTHDTHAVQVVTLSVDVLGCFSSLLCILPPMVGESCSYLLSEFNDTVNCAVHCGTCSHWVRYYCRLWLVAWDVEVHENENYYSTCVIGWLSSLLTVCRDVCRYWGRSPRYV